MFTFRLISAVCWKLPELWPGSITMTLPLREPERAGAEETGEARGAVGVVAPGCLSSSVGEVRVLPDVAVVDDRTVARSEPLPPPEPPTASYTSHPSSAPGTSAA